MKSLAELEAIKNKVFKQVAMRKEDGEHTTRIAVAMGTCGIAAGARAVVTAMVDEVAKLDLKHVTVTQIDCLGKCAQEPMVEISIPGQSKVTYVNITPDKAREIVNKHVAGGQICTAYTQE